MGASNSFMRRLLQLHLYHHNNSASSYCGLYSTNIVFDDTHSFQAKAYPISKRTHSLYSNEFQRVERQRTTINWEPPWPSVSEGTQMDTRGKFHHLLLRKAERTDNVPMDFQLWAANNNDNDNNTINYSTTSTSLLPPSFIHLQALLVLFILYTAAPTVTIRILPPKVQ